MWFHSKHVYLYGLSSSAAPVDNDTGEPFYIDPIQRSDLYESVQTAQMYEVPTNSVSPGQKWSESDHTAQKRDDNDVTYHTLEPPVTGRGKAGERGHGEQYYHELEAPGNHSDEDTDEYYELVCHPSTVRDHLMSCIIYTLGLCFTDW